jgi:hypothetical protein
MSKLDLLTIAIVIVCLAALGYLVYKIVNLMNPPEAPTTSIEDSYDAKAVDEGTYTDWDDEVNNADSDVDLDDDEAGTSIADDAENTTTDAGSTFDNDEMDNDSEGLAESETVTSSAGSGSGDSGTTASSYGTTSSSSGKYMVVAGSFRQRNNADSHAARLRKLGYSNTEVRIFDRGSFAVVLVDRFSSLSQAKRLVSDLAEDGVDAIVSTKN